MQTECDEVQFDSNLANALAQRASSPEMQKLMGKWKKTLTPTQKARHAATSTLSLPKLKALISQRMLKAPQRVKEIAATAVTTLTDKESLAYFLIDLEYGIVGSLPPKPVKAGNKDKLFGKSIKFGSPHGPEKEGVVIGVNKPKKGEPTLQLLVAGEKAPVTVSDEQIIAVGEAKVATETWTKAAPAHKFNSKSDNLGAETVPEAKE